MAGQRILVEVIGSQVEAMLRRLALPADWQAQIVELAIGVRKRDNTDALRQSIKARLRRLRDLHELGAHGLTEYKRRRADPKAQLDSLRRPARSALIQTVEYLETLAGLWDEATTEQQRKLLQGMIRKV